MGSVFSVPATPAATPTSSPPTVVRVKHAFDCNDNHDENFSTVAPIGKVWDHVPTDDELTLVFRQCIAALPSDDQRKKQFDNNIYFSWSVQQPTDGSFVGSPVKAVQLILPLDDKNVLENMYHAQTTDQLLRSISCLNSRYLKSLF